jgi:inorganic pyrophosphatase
MIVPLQRHVAGSARRLLVNMAPALAASMRPAAHVLPPLCRRPLQLHPSAPLSIRTGPPTPHHSTRASATKSVAKEAYRGRTSGEKGTLEWRHHMQHGGRDISAWHDIPLMSDESSANQLLFNYVNEIPRGTRPKLEVATKEPGNPIKQDVKKGVLRNFTYGDLPFNYGLMPQTWEDPSHSHPLTKRGGDNDPLDLVELSEEPIPVGAVRSVKVLGIMALLDEAETDWKVLAIDAAHPLAYSIKTAEDIEKHWPGKIDAVREWFRNYKTTDGKGMNDFAADGAVLDVGQAQAVIWETHAAWARLCKGEIPANGLAIPDTPNSAALGEERQ